MGAQEDEADGDLMVETWELEVMPDIKDVPGVANEVEGGLDADLH